MAKPIVDLKRSVWDKEKSNPEKGEYVFEKKVYYKNRDFREGYIHPFKIKWCKYSENDYPRPFSSYIMWQHKFEATPVVVGDDYWPEGFVPDSEGKYTYLDLVCVKIPIEKHLATKKEAVRRAHMQVKSIKKNFVDSTKKAGMAIDEDVLEEEFEKMSKDMGITGV